MEALGSAWNPWKRLEVHRIHGVTGRFFSLVGPQVSSKYRSVHGLKPVHSIVLRVTEYSTQWHHRPSIANLHTFTADIRRVVGILG